MGGDVWMRAAMAKTLELFRDLPMLTGLPPVRGGGDIPQRISVISVPASVLRIRGAG